MSKILLVANTDWYLYNFRISLARFLRGRNHEVVFISPHGPYVEELLAEGFRWIEWSVNRRSMNVVNEIKSFWSLYKVYAAEKPDLIHHFTIKPVLYGTLSSIWLKKIRVVNSITGLGYVFQSAGIQARLVRGLVMLLYRILFRSARVHLVFENSNDYDYFVSARLIQPDRGTVIQGVGVDLDKFSPSVGSQEEQLVVLPSRMLWDKGVDVFVEAAKILKKSLSARFVLVGEPDIGNPTSIPDQTLLEWQLHGWVEWWGFQNDMPAIYRRSTLVVLPSLGEGLPKSLMEAAACGIPIVATDVPGCREVVLDGHNGFLVPPGQPQALADAIQKVLADDYLRARMGENSRHLAVEKFDDRNINMLNDEIYRALLSV